MAGDASLSITPVMKWNFERSCYRWLVTRHPAQFERMDFTAQILQSASRARKAFYECGWAEAKVLIRPSDGKFERTPFFDTIIRRGLRNSTRFDASTLSEEEIETLGMHRDESLGFKLQIRHFRNRRKDDDGSNNAHRTNSCVVNSTGSSINSGAIIPHRRGVSDASAPGSHSGSPPPTSPSPHHHPQPVRSASAHAAAVRDSFSVSGTRSSIAQHHQRSGPPTAMDWGPRPNDDRDAGALVAHPRWGRESAWQPDRRSLEAAATPNNGASAMLCGQHSRPQWRSASASRERGGPIGEREQRGYAGVRPGVPTSRSAGPAWEHHTRPLVSVSGPGDTIWEDRVAPRRMWGYHDRQSPPLPAWEAGVRNGDSMGKGYEEDYAGGEHFAKASLVTTRADGTRGGGDPIGTGGAPRPHHRFLGEGGCGDKEAMRRNHDGGHARDEGGVESSRSGRSSVHNAPPDGRSSFVHPLNVRGGIPLHRRDDGSDSRVARSSGGPPDVAGSGDGTLLAQGYMRLAAMREESTSDGGSGRDGGNHGTAARGVKGIDRRSPVLRYESGRASPTERSIVSGQPSPLPPVLTTSLKRDYSEGSSCSASPSFGGDSRLPSISQALPGVKEPRSSRPEGARSCSPTDDRARPLKKRRCGSVGSNSEGSGGGIVRQVEKGRERQNNAVGDGAGHRDGEKIAAAQSQLVRRDSSPVASTLSVPDPACEQLTKELEESERELLSARDALEAARMRFEKLSRAHKAKQEQVMAAAGERAVQASHTLRECANLHSLARSCAAAAAEAPDAGANSSGSAGRGAATVTSRDSSADRSAEQDRSDRQSRSLVAVGESKLSSTERTLGSRTAASVADEMMRDVKIEAEILCGMGRATVSSSSSSSSSLRPKQHSPEARKRNESVSVSTAGATSVPDSSSSHSTKTTSIRESTHRDRSSENSPLRSPSRTASSLRMVAWATPSESRARRPSDESAPAFPAERNRPGSPREEDETGNSKETRSRGGSTMGVTANRSNKGPDKGTANGFRVSISGSRSSPPSAREDNPMRFTPPATTAATTASTSTNEKPASKPARVGPTVTKTPGSPSVSGETDSEHSDTTTAGGAGGKAMAGGIGGREKDAVVERGGFDRKSGPRFRRFNASVGSWGGGEGREAPGGGREAGTRTNGYVPPLVRLAAVAAAGGRGDYGGHGVMKERFDYV